MATETINPGDKDLSAVLSKIKPLNPEMIFTAASTPRARSSRTKAPRPCGSRSWAQQALAKQFLDNGPR